MPLVFRKVSANFQGIFTKITDMKFIWTRNSNWLAALVLALCFTTTSCEPTNNDEADSIVFLRGPASGGQERPIQVSTPANGTLSARYNRDSRQLMYTITWNGLSANPMAMHFHGPATPQEVAPPIVTIAGFPAATSGTVTGNAQLTAEQESQLLSGKWYYNIHTPNHPGGEIRGQVLIGR